MRHYTPAGWVDDGGSDSISGWGTEDDYKEVLEQLKTTPENFLTAVVYSLTWDLENGAAIITGIYCDQWCGVSGSGTSNDASFIPMPTDDKKVQTWFQCDRPEWGIAATWKAFVKEFGLRKEKEKKNVD